MAGFSDDVFARPLAPPPRAGPFIVTLYGDVVQPRGIPLWMGTLIDCCTVHGINESLVRTAVSRLVGSGWLEGQRIGRRSFYRLAAEVRPEVSAAASLLYDPPAPPDGWLLVLGGRAAQRMQNEPGWKALSADVAIAPARDDVARPPDALKTCEGGASEASLSEFAAGHWPLMDVDAAYRAFLGIFEPVNDALSAGQRPDDATALALRVRLVHAFRAAALADPGLPRSALPQDWPADRARAVFRACYMALSEAADRHVGAAFQGPDGPLPSKTAETAWRLSTLGPQPRKD